MEVMERTGEDSPSDDVADDQMRIIYDACLHKYLRAKYDILSSMEETAETRLLLPPQVGIITYPTCSVLQPPSFSKSDIYSYFFDKYVKGGTFHANPRIRPRKSSEHLHVTMQKEYELDAYGLLEVLVFAITLVSALSMTGLFQIQIFLKAVVLHEKAVVLDEHPLTPFEQEPLIASLEELPEIPLNPVVAAETDSTPDSLSEPSISIDIPSPKFVANGSPVACMNDENRPNAG